MASYLIRRFFLMLLTLFGISVLVFVMLRLVPGNIADILFDAAGLIDTADKAKLEHDLGIDRPIVIQYAHWVERAGARRSRLFLRLGEAGAAGDRAAHPDHRQARRARARVLDAVRRAARRHQRGAAELGARLCAARGQPERTVDAVVLARAADPDGLRRLVRLDPDLHRPAGRLLERAAVSTASRPRRSASAPRRW